MTRRRERSELYYSYIIYDDTKPLSSCERRGTNSCENVYTRALLSTGAIARVLGQSLECSSGMLPGSNRSHFTKQNLSANRNTNLVSKLFFSSHKSSPTKKCCSRNAKDSSGIVPGSRPIIESMEEPADMMLFIDGDGESWKKMWKKVS